MFSAQKKSLVNLLPRNEFETSFWGKFLHWAIFYGRYLIILTEIIVILAFILRFRVDADLSNINDAINGKKSIIAANLKFESVYKGIQNRLGEAGKIVASPQYSQALDLITGQIPEGIKITTLNITAHDFNLSGSGDQASFNVLVDRMLAQKSFKNVSLSNVTYDTTGVVKFILKANY